MVPSRSRGRRGRRPSPASWRAAAVAGLAIASGCDRSPPATSAAEAATPADASEPRARADAVGGSPWFADVADSRGLTFRLDPGPIGAYFMPQIIGSGAALFDFDDDGRLDLYLIQNGGPDSGSTNRLYHQEADGSFRDVSDGSGVDVAGFGMGAAAGDIDNDGRVDLAVTEYGNIRLFHNRGAGRFREVTDDAGLARALWGTSLGFLDFDGDGRLDLAVVHYLDYDPSRPCDERSGRRDFCGPDNFPGTITKLYRNLGPSDDTPARFADVTLAAGLGKAFGPGLGIAPSDFDGDGRPDILVANDGKPNHLWINRRDGTFAEEGVARGLAFDDMGHAQANMGIAVGDADGDGHIDVFVTHLTAEKHCLWLGMPGGTYQESTAAAGLTRLRWRGTGFGTLMADFDLDGDLDLAVANGRVERAKRATEGNTPSEPGLDPFWAAYAERDQLFENDGRGRFRDVSPANGPFSGAATVSRVLACGDIDNDGAIDLLVTTIGGPARLFRNVAPRRGHWLTVRALDPALRRDAYGTVVRVRAGDRAWTRSLNPSYSYLVSNDPRGHFGLGPAESIDAIEATWPDGSRETFDGGPADRLVVLRKGEGWPLR